LKVSPAIPLRTISNSAADVEYKISSKVRLFTIDHILVYEADNRKGMVVVSTKRIYAGDGEWIGEILKDKVLKYESGSSTPIHQVETYCPSISLS
jgi:hypothetical protein